MLPHFATIKCPTDSMNSKTVENHELDLAREFVEETDRHLFLTGKAGTGKTTFLHHLKKTSAKRMIVTAPTGVAAINAGGVTLHSFFQIPLGPFLPGTEAFNQHRQRMFRFSREKRRIIQSLDLLVIDEISMVRADLLDAVDAVLRHHRRNNAPFGGVQLLMIGDLYQLSPVAKKEEWDLLRQQYETVYFFSSRALADVPWMTIELKHIYRQSDARFIDLLNRVRENRLDAEGLKTLNRRTIPNFTPKDGEGYITLTTHNNRANAINNERLGALSGKPHDFQAAISGDFPDHAHPAPKRLTLKAGAQVMFLRNDASPEKRYYNGKIGKIAALSPEEIRIQCPGEPHEIPVEPLEWENIRYTLNEENHEIEEDIIGKFRQFPLKPAWAITIHKSQGLTFDRAVIDAQFAFAPGQFYVALSRLKSLEGLVLRSPVPAEGIAPDVAVNAFVKAHRENPPTKDGLSSAKMQYQQRLLLDCFDFGVLRNRLNRLMRLLLGNAEWVRVSRMSGLKELQKAAEAEIFSVGTKFQRQLKTLFQKDVLPASDPRILERIEKASGWFQPRFSRILSAFLQQLRVETDNRELRKRIDNGRDQLKLETDRKLAGVKACEKGFSPARYLRLVSKAETDASPQQTEKDRMPSFNESDISHPELYADLKGWRTRMAREKGVPAFQILHQRVLIQIAVHLPDNPADLQKIKGVGRKTVQKYGDALIKRVSAYRRKHGIKTVEIPEKKGPEPVGETVPEKAAQPDTKQITFSMFHNGASVSDIAKERGLAESTIWGHLGFFVEKGKLDVDRLLTQKQQSAIEAALSKTPGNSLKTVRDALEGAYSYGEIKVMLAHRQYSSNREQTP